MIQIGPRGAHRVADRRAAAGTRQVVERGGNRRAIVGLDPAQLSDAAREAVDADLDREIGALLHERVGRVEHRLDRFARDDVLGPAVVGDALAHRAGRVDENGDGGAEPLVHVGLIRRVAALGGAAIGGAAGTTTARVAGGGRERRGGHPQPGVPGRHVPAVYRSDFARSSARWRPPAGV